MAKSEVRPPEDEHLDRVWEMMEKIDTCMLVTMEASLHRGRPMTPCVRRAENAIYFLTDKTSHKLDELFETPSVCLTFAGDGDFVSVSGEARVLSDRPLIDDLWSIAAQAWWEGPEDPNIAVIEVTPSEAQYWTGPNKLVASVVMLTAAMTGSRPDLGENRKVDMN